VQPALLARLGAIETLADFARYPLIHSRTEPWVAWLRRVGGDTTRAETVPLSEDSSATLTAVEQGKGVALARWSLVAADLAAGRLVRPMLRASSSTAPGTWLPRRSISRCPRSCASRLADRMLPGIPAADRRDAARRVSRAFVKEPDGPEAEPELPELAVSPHRNLVTPAGLAQIDAERRRLRELLSAGGPRPITAPRRAMHATCATGTSDARPRKSFRMPRPPLACGSDPGSCYGPRTAAASHFASSARTNRPRQTAASASWRRWPRHARCRGWRHGALGDGEAEIIEIA